jgi:hypothetical protein
MKAYVIRVGIQSYGARPTLEQAIERAKYWSEQKPGVLVSVQYTETVWDNGVDIGMNILRGELQDEPPLRNTATPIPDTE